MQMFLLHVVFLRSKSVQSAMMYNDIVVKLRPHSLGVTSMPMNYNK